MLLVSRTLITRILNFSVSTSADTTRSCLGTTQESASKTKRNSLRQSRRLVRWLFFRIPFDLNNPDISYFSLWHFLHEKRPARARLVSEHQLGSRGLQISSSTEPILSMTRMEMLLDFLTWLRLSRESTRVARLSRTRRSPDQALSRHK